MSSRSLSHPDFAINLLSPNFNIQLLEHLFLELAKAKALIKMTLCDHFLEQPKDILFDYLSLLDETIHAAVEIEQALARKTVH